MLLQADIPELKAYELGFPGFWLAFTMSEIFEGPPISRALIVNFVRHVEIAFQSYRGGSANALAFVENKRHTIPIYAFLASTSRFEQCISNTHRAIEIMRALRRHHAVPESIRALYGKKPNFAKQAFGNSIRNLRDAVQHTYEQMIEGKIAEDSSHVLGISGPEEEVEQDGKIVCLKTIDRLTLGPHHITFASLHDGLVEMGECAERLALYKA